jgi:hypothetical protein
MVLYSTIKENEILSFAGMWIELENIISKISQSMSDVFLSYV